MQWREMENKSLSFKSPILILEQQSNSDFKEGMFCRGGSDPFGVTDALRDNANY